jgi:hypothetical protein
MSGLEDPRRAPSPRQAELERLVPGGGLGARLDRGAWSALSQGTPGKWSWPRAVGTVALAMAIGVVIFLTVYRELSFLVGLALAYGFLLYRARTIDRRYRGRGERA